MPSNVAEGPAQRYLQAAFQWRVSAAVTPKVSPIRPALHPGSNLTSTKARMLLMACLMKFGSLPVAKDPANPTKPEMEATASGRTLSASVRHALSDGGEAAGTAVQYRVVSSARWPRPSRGARWRRSIGLQCDFHGIGNVLPDCAACCVHTQADDASEQNVRGRGAGPTRTDSCLTRPARRVAGLRERRDEFVLLADDQTARGHASGPQARAHLGAARDGIERRLMWCRA